MEHEALIGPETVGLLHVPSDYVTPRQGLLAIWRRHLVANVGVRSRDYMEALFRTHFPRGRLVEIEDGRIPADVLDRAGNIVLLYPDSIGMDFGEIERAIASRWPAKRVLVLNGRRRMFPLDAETRRRLALRRFLEAWRLPEIMFFLVFVVVTPLLALFDIVRGRR